MKRTQPLIPPQVFPARITPALPGEKISDKATLLWERYFKPMQNAAAALNAAVRNTENVLGGIILEMEGKSSETHIFDPDRMMIVQRPTAGENGAMGK